MAVAVMQAYLCLPGPLIRLWARCGASGCVTVVPGDLDQEPSGVAVAGLGDVAAIAGGVLARGDTQPRRELPRVAEAGEVPDLGDQPERCQRPLGARARPQDTPAAVAAEQDELAREWNNAAPRNAQKPSTRDSTQQLAGRRALRP
jgi:hypothetical protein